MTIAGWRFWRIERGRLVSPFAQDVLADEGTVSADCDDFLIAWLGVSFFKEKADVLRAVKVLDSPDLAVTEGIVTGPITRDMQGPVYHVQGLLGVQTLMLPEGHRCRSYQVTRIYVDLPVNGYGAEVCRMRQLVL